MVLFFIIIGFKREWNNYFYDMNIRKKIEEFLYSIVNIKYYIVF